MTYEFYIQYPPNFSFRHTAQSHGWYDLRPFAFDEETATLSHVFDTGRGIASASIKDDGGRLLVRAEGDGDRKDVENAVRHILRLDDDLTGFYDLAMSDENLSWVTRHNAGRLLRSPSVWEDLVKTICTTNCSWGLTKKMVHNLVENLGAAGLDEQRAFPTPEAMASVTVDFYRDEIRAGYRSPYFLELAESVASGQLDPESWLNSNLPTTDLKKEMKKVKGVGDYAAENLLKLVGRYDGLALDSWLRAEFYKRHNSEKPCPDKKVERHYKKFGTWKGLAIWCDMTERWFD